MAGSNYYYASGLIAGQLLDISRFPQVFTLLGSNLLKSWNNKQLLKEAVQDFVETVTAANPFARIFIGSIIPQPGASSRPSIIYKSSTGQPGRKSLNCARGVSQ